MGLVTVTPNPPHTHTWRLEKAGKGLLGSLGRVEDVGGGVVMHGNLWGDSQAIFSLVSAFSLLSVSLALTHINIHHLSPSALLIICSFALYILLRFVFLRCFSHQMSFNFLSYI